MLTNAAAELLLKQEGTLFNQVVIEWLLAVVLAGMGALITFYANTRVAIATLRQRNQDIARMEAKLDTNTSLAAEIGRTLAETIPILKQHSTTIEEINPEFHKMQAEVAVLREKITKIEEIYRNIDLGMRDIRKSKVRFSSK